MTAYALANMTRLPIQPARTIRDNQIGKSLLFHPVAGLIVALLLILVQYVLLAVNLAMVAAVVLLMWVWITGLVHIPGFMKTITSSFENRSLKSSDLSEESRQTSLTWVPTSAVILLLFLNPSSALFKNQFP